jgi:tetratricopeptide (TPR) repeat protein
MFERFTEKAIKVILLAQEEARRLGHNFVGVEFIFLGLIGEATGIAAKVLRQQGITLKNARIEVEKILGRGSGISPEMSPVDIPFTESAKLVLNNAVSIARQLEHESINTEHLLIGIIQEGESTARILQNLQVNPQDLAISLIQYFQQQSSNQLPQTVYVLLYNVGTDNEGIHTITDQEKQTILMFESSADATNFARQLRKQNFPVPSVEGMSVEEIISFCEEVGYDWEFVPEGANKIPPIESRESGNTHEEYLNFLMKALNKVYENPDPKYIYPFFEHNLDKLDESLIIILNNWAKNQLASVETEQAIYIAGNICNFSTLIQQFSLGNIATNLEIAIAGYQVVLTGFNFDAFPEVWADTQDNLASAYQNRIRGNIAENLELSIAAYTEALKVRTFDKFPKDWADTQNNLANTYAKRIRGDKAENLELAIAAYTEALKVRTFDNSPEDWATTQHNLALAYSKRIRGDKAENLELAIATCNEALKVRTIDRIPLGWAMTQNNLANAYSNRIRGDKAENLEKAISAYQEALKVFTFDAFPQQWAATQNNLANAYSNRIRGDKAENIKQAVMCYQNALQGYETAGDFLNAAEMGLTLGKVKVDRGEWYQGLAYLEKSLKIYRQFDDLKSRADTIYQIAHTHHLIGNHEKASIYYRDALRFYEYLKHDRGVAFCKASLGRLMLQIGFVEKAKELLKEATFIFKELNNEQEIAKIAEVLNCLAKIKEKQAV